MTRHNPMETMIQLENLNDVNNWLGRSNWTGDSNFDGLFNEFRIYDEALSADQIAANTAAGPDVIPVLGNCFSGSEHCYGQRQNQEQLSRRQCQSTTTRSPALPGASTRRME